MINLWYIIVPIVLGVFFLAALGIGYWFYIKSRPKKETYHAEIYEEVGKVSPLFDNDGKQVDCIPINSLKLVSIDVIDKIEVGKGLSPYRLVKANESISEIRGEHLTNMPDGKRKVHVLKKGVSYTLMTYGTDPVGRLVFRPLPYSVSTMLLHNYHLKKTRNQDTKDHVKMLLALAMVITVMFGMIGMAYFLGQAWMKSAEQINLMNKDNIAAEKARIAFYQSTYGSVPNKVNAFQQLGRQDLPAETPG